ncbi:MAG: YeeE/YedE thiosulfate transporter family protein [Planctomycetota bacterium]
MKYTYPYLAGAALGVVLFLSFYVTGHGLGASGGLQRVGAVAVKAVAPEHADRTPQWAEVAGGTRNPLDHWLVWSVVGVALGGLLSGLLARRVRPEVRKGPAISTATRLIAALAGGLLVGYAARLARGCTSGQALSGGAVLSVGSWLFMIMVFVGGYLAAWPFRRLWN